jgi:glutamate receptor, ionotropic, plant
VDLIKNEQVQAIIGPQTSAEAAFVAHIGNRTHVPILSYSATSPELSPAQTPFFVRTAVNDSFQAAPIAAVLAEFRWHAAVVVYEDSPYGAGILPAMADALQGVGAKIMDRAAVPLDATDDRLDTALYRFMAMPTRVFVVHMNRRLAARLFRRARNAGMMSEDYAWIATDGLGTFADALPREDIDAMEGVVSLRPFVEMTEQVRNFSARFRARLRREYPDDGRIVHDPTVMMLWAYDTAWAIAAAAEAAGISSPAFKTPQRSAAAPTDLSRLGVSATGEAFLDAVHATSFRGLAGNFTLVDGQLQLPAYEVVNVVGKGSRSVGFWKPESGISQALKKNANKGLKQILWPGDSWSSPKGWVVSPNGEQLRVYVPVKHGFKQFVDVSNDSATRTPNVTGYCIEVFDAVMRDMPYPVSYQYVPYDGSSESYENLVFQVVEQVSALTTLADQSYRAHLRIIDLCAELMKLVCVWLPAERGHRGRRRDDHGEQDGRGGLHHAVHRVGVVDGGAGEGRHEHEHVDLPAAAHHQPLARQPRLLLLHRLRRLGD